MNIHKEEVNSELIGTKNVKREVNPFKHIGYSMYHLLKHLKKGTFSPHRIFTHFLDSKTRPFAFQHF
jgi:hypothetical protein